MARSGQSEVQHADAVRPEALASPRELPRVVQIWLAGILVGVVVVAIVLGSRESGGVTDPGATLPEVGDTLAMIPLTDTAGRPFDLASLEGRPVWINIWASWCPPCRTEMPDLEIMYREALVTHPDLVLVSLNTADSRGAGMRFFQDLGLTSTLVFNDGTARLGPYRVQNYPSQILVGRDGIVQQVLQKTVSREQAERELNVLLADADAQPR